MVNKLLIEYNDRQLSIIDTIRARNGTLVNKTENKIKKSKEFTKRLAAINLLKGKQRAAALYKYNKDIDSAVNQFISNKYIRSYRTIVDDLFEGGIVPPVKPTINYLRNNIRAPGSRDGKLLPSKTANGMFYMFMYSPQGKDTLEYWDRLPLVLVLNQHDNGFTGLNMHLIDPASRLKIFNLMLMYKRGTRYRSHMKIVWEIIKRVDRFRMGRPCIRRYLSSHIQSKITRIPDADWEVMLLLPSPKFVGMQVEAVHKENKKKAYQT